MKEITVSLGTNIVSANERMTSISLIELYERIAHASSAFVNQIEVLRSIYQMDGNKYTLMKKALPYFVCAHFEPEVRRLENFTSASSFVLDIDKIDENTISMDELRNALDKDNRISMMFTSPSGAGLKLLFLLDKPCLDHNVYSTFYKQFALEFAKEYGIEAFIDLKTNDVTRACFLSSDPKATFNTTATAIHLENYVNLESVDLFVKKEQVPTINLETESESSLPQISNIEPDQETMLKIKERLELNKKKRLHVETKPTFVPEEVTNILTNLKSFVEETGVELYDTRIIQYGIKLMFKTKQLRAEINLFYGHRGYSVVESPKRGTSMELNSMMAQLINDYVNGVNK